MQTPFPSVPISTGLPGTPLSISAATIDEARYDLRARLCPAGSRTHFMPESKEYRRGYRYGPWHPCTLAKGHKPDHVWSTEPETNPDFPDPKCLYTYRSPLLSSAALDEPPRAIPYVPDPDPLPGQHSIPHCIAPEDLVVPSSATTAALRAANLAVLESPHTYPSGWWVDIREALNYELDEQGDAARHVGCTVDSRPFAVAAGRASGVTLEAFLIAVAKHRNKCHGGQSE